MSEPEVITMVICPYCEEEWVREDDELVCKNCEPALKIDLAIAEMVKATDELASHPPDRIQPRIDLLRSIHTNLTKVIKDARRKK